MLDAAWETRFDMSSIGRRLTVDLMAFLDSKMTDLETIVYQAKQSIDIHDDEMLLVVGSLVEGLGTTKSDLDLLLLTKREPSDLPPNEHFNWVSGKCLVDLWVLSKPYVDNLLKRFSDWCAAPWDATDTAAFDLPQRTLLHRIATGIWLASEDNQTDEPYPRPDVVDISRLKFHVARHEARTVQVDMAGLVDSEDYRTLAFAAVQLAGLAIDAVLAGHQQNNFTLKWRSRLLDDVPSTWSPPVNPVFRGAVGSVIWNLLRFPETYKPEDILPFAHRISAYSRAIFVWSERTLLHRQFNVEQKQFPFGEIETHGVSETLPFLDFDVDFSMTADGLSLGRLNEFDEAMPISTAELDAALLFDGQTNIEKADRWISATHEMDFSTELFLKRCAEHGLLRKDGFV